MTLEQCNTVDEVIRNMVKASVQQGFHQSQECNAPLNIVDAQGCTVTNSKIIQGGGDPTKLACKTTYKGTENEFKTYLEQRKDQRIKDLAQCAEKTVGGLFPGSAKAINIGRISESAVDLVHDSILGTCSQRAGGVNEFLCTGSNADNIVVQQGEQASLFQNCVNKSTATTHIDNQFKESSKQIASAGNEGFGMIHIYEAIVVIVGEILATLAIFNKWLDVKWTLFCLLVIAGITFFGVWYIDKHQIGAKTSASLEKQPCADCSMFDNDPKSCARALCTFQPHNVSGPKPVTGPGPSHPSTPETLGLCRCDDSQYPNGCARQCYRQANEEACVSAYCGWIPEGTKGGGSKCTGKPTWCKPNEMKNQLDGDYVYNF